MVKNKLFKIVFVVSIILALSSCENFEELNTDPTKMTKVNAASLLTQVCYDAGVSSRYYGAIGNYIGQYWTNTSLIDQRHRYDFRGSDSEALYDRLYGVLYNIKDLKTRAVQEELDDYLGAALILEVYLYNYLTDVFGPVPYTQAIQADNLHFTPKFDSQELIYKSNLDSLDKAYSLLETKPEGNFVRGGDPFYDGDNTLWRKLSNSLKLRMLMKMVKVEPSSASDIQKLIDAGELLSAHNETCGIIYDGNFGLEANVNKGTEDSGALGETFAVILHETLDPRRPQMARLGVDKEGNPVNFDQDSVPVYLGVPSGEEPDIIRNFEGLAVPYTGLNGLTAPSALLSHAEVELFIAEAILQGYAEGDANEHYLAGIRSSCQWWGVDDVEIDNHLAKESVALSGNKDDALKQVWREQYINFYYQGYDGWLNYRRVHYPEFHVGSAMIVDTIMKRMVYPPLLKAVNTSNYNEAVSMLDKGDHLLSSGWWSN